MGLARYTIQSWLQGFEHIPERTIIEQRIVQGTCKKGTGGRFLFAKIEIEFAPANRLIFETTLEPEIEAIARERRWLESIWQGTLDVFLIDPLPAISQFRCNLLSIEFHEIDSSPGAFRLAARDAARSFFSLEKFK